MLAKACGPAPFPCESQTPGVCEVGQMPNGTAHMGGAAASAPGTVVFQTCKSELSVLSFR